VSHVCHDGGTAYVTVASRVNGLTGKPPVNRTFARHPWGEVNIVTEFSMSELSLETGEMLPSREALSFFSWANVNAYNQALALNVATVNSLAAAAAVQTIVIN